MIFLEFFYIDWIAWLIATLTCQFIGALWLGPLFGEAWRKYSGVSNSELIKRAGNNPEAKYVTAFIIQGLVNFALATMIDILHVTTLTDVIILSLSVYIGFVGSYHFGGVLWEGYNLEFFLINTGHRFVTIFFGALIYHLISYQYLNACVYAARYAGIWMKLYVCVCLWVGGIWLAYLIAHVIMMVVVMVAFAHGYVFEMVCGFKYGLASLCVGVWYSICLSLYRCFVCYSLCESMLAYVCKSQQQAQC